MAQIRASLAGACPRLLVYTILGYDLEPPSSFARRIFEQGDIQEEETVKYIEAEGLWKVRSRQMDTMWRLDGHEVTGHIDGLLAEDDSEKLLEIKAMGKDRYEKLKTEGLPAFPRYECQLACYYGALQQQGIVLTGAEFVSKLWQKNEYHWLSLGPSECEEIVAHWESRITELLDLVSSVEVGDEESIAQEPDEFGCAKCPAKFHCFPELIPDPLFGDDAEEIDQFIAKWKQANAVQKVAEETKKGIAAELDELLGESQAISATLGTVRRVESMRKYLNKKSMPADFAEELNTYYEEKPSTSIRVFPSKGNE